VVYFNGGTFALLRINTELAAAAGRCGVAMPVLFAARGGAQRRKPTTIMLAEERHGVCLWRREAEHGVAER